MDKITKKSENEIGWDDVIGMDDAKQEAKEIVSLIKDHAQLNEVGGRIIRGLLMFGMPGCGKTYLASAMANEAGLPFLAKSGSEFVEMYVGVGASRIRHLFQEARELASSKGGCIIFIDEIDALGAKREDARSGGDREYNQTLNQLLTELDGLKEKNEQYNIVIIGATNVNEDFLDAALLRPGRFDRKLYVELPGLEDRTKLFDYYLAKIKFNAQEIDSNRLARVTAGWSPADISNIVREGALITVRNQKETMGLKEIDEARERVELGLKRRIKLGDEEKRSTAVHEAGHAVVTYFLAGSREIFKLSIIPRKETAGVMWAPGKAETLVHNKIQILSSIKVSLGGYAAEKLKCRATSDGVSSDFSNAMQYAHQMVWSWGMGKSGFIGNFSSLTNQRTGQTLMSEEMMAKLDADVQDIMQECMKETETLLKEKDAILEKLMARLLEKEELNYDEIEAVFKEAG
jgi:cell division protease FtsH